MTPGIAGSMARAGGGVTNATIEPESVAYFAAMTTKPTAKRQKDLNTMIAGLKSDGVLALLDNLNILASHDEQSARANIASPSNPLLQYGNPTFAVDRGLTSPSSNNYWKTSRGASFSGSKYQVQNKFFGAYFNTKGNTGDLPIGASDAYDNYYYSGSGIDTNYIVFDNDNATNGNYITMSYLGTTAVRGTTAGYRVFVNGSSIYSFANIGTTVTTRQFSLCGNTGYGSQYRMAAFYSGAALSDTQMLSLHNRLNTYLTTIGANA